VRKSIVVIACLGMASFGIVMAAPGASLPAVIERYGIDKLQAGGLLSLLSFSVLAGSVVFGPIADRYGYRGMFLFAFGTIVLGLEASAFAPTFAWLRVAVALTGFSGGLLNGGTNALVADVSGERRAATLTFVGGFFGIGAAGLPFVLATLSDEFSHTSILAVVPLIVLLPLVLTAFAPFPPPKQPHGFPIRDARRLLRDPFLLLIGLMLFLESGMETTVGGWVSTLFAEELRVATDRAPIYLGLFWLGMMLTRITLGLMLKNQSGVRVLFVSISVALVGALVLVSSRDVGVVAAAIFVLGCGFAAVFPVMFGFVGDRYADLSGTALSIVMVMALVGGTLMPYAAGALGSLYGLHSSFLIVPTSLVLLAVLLGGLSRRLRSEEHTSELQSPS